MIDRFYQTKTKEIKWASIYKKDGIITIRTEPKFLKVLEVKKND